MAVILTFRCDCVCNRRILMTKNCLNVFAHLNRMGNKTQVACLYVIPVSLEMQFTQKLKVYQHPYVVLKLTFFFVYAMKVHGFQNMLFGTPMTFNVWRKLFQNIFFCVPVIQVLKDMRVSRQQTFSFCVIYRFNDSKFTV